MATTSLPTTQQISTYNCFSTVAQLDLVYYSTTDNMLYTAESNNTTQPVIGIVIKKTTQTTCEVLLEGMIDYLVNPTLAAGIIYIGTNGLLTVTPPTTGYRQTLGLSFGSGRINFSPEYTRVIAV